MTDTPPDEGLNWQDVQIETRRRAGRFVDREDIEAVLKGVEALATRTPEIPASDDVVEKVARAIYESAQAENDNHSALPWHIVRDGETAARWFAYARAAIAAYQASALQQGEKR